MKRLIVLFMAVAFVVGINSVHTAIAKNSQVEDCTVVIEHGDVSMGECMSRLNACELSKDPAKCHCKTFKVDDNLDAYGGNHGQCIKELRANPIED